MNINFGKKIHIIIHKRIRLRHGDAPGDGGERAHDDWQTDAQRVETTRDDGLQVEALTEAVTCRHSHACARKSATTAAM